MADRFEDIAKQLLNDCGQAGGYEAIAMIAHALRTEYERGIRRTDLANEMIKIWQQCPHQAEVRRLLMQAHLELIDEGQVEESKGMAAAYQLLIEFGS